MECKSRKRGTEKQLNLLLQKDRWFKKRKEFIRKASLGGRQSPAFSSPPLSPDSVCSEASTPTSRSSGGTDKQLEHRGRRRQLEVALMDQQESENPRMPSMEPLSTPGTPREVHTLSLEEETLSASPIHPTFLPLSIVLTKKNQTNIFESASSY